jgi:hypothetical protein
MIFKNYDISANGYLFRTNRLLRLFGRTNNPKLLVYASLELRICIERVLFEYLVLIHLDEKKLKSFDASYRTKDFKSAIYEVEPEFTSKLNFVNIYLRVIHTFYGLQGMEISIPKEVVIPDFDLLSEFYGKLGNSLHSLKNPAKTTQSSKWNQIVQQTVFESFDYLHHIVFSGQLHFKMNEKGYIHYEVYKSNTISEGDLITYMLADFEEKKDEFISLAKSGELLSVLLENVEWQHK